MYSQQIVHRNMAIPQSDYSFWTFDEFLFAVSRGAFLLCKPESRAREVSRREAPESFEQTYPQYPFAPLVSLGILFGQWYARVLRKRPDDKLSNSAPNAPNASSHASRPRLH